MPLGDHAIGDIQAQPGALTYRLSGEERFEDLLLHLRRYANACITDFDQGPTVLPRCADSQRAAVRHRVYRIVDQVRPNLIELGGMCWDHRQRLIEVLDDFDVAIFVDLVTEHDQRALQPVPNINLLVCRPIHLRILLGCSH